MVSKHKLFRDVEKCSVLPILVLVLFQTVFVHGFSVKKVIETVDFLDSTPLTNHDDVVVTDPTEESQFINDEENEIFRDKRDVSEMVTEKVPFEASPNDDAGTTSVNIDSFSEAVTDQPSDFVRPITPDPDADPNYPTVNPLPPDFDISNIEGVNATGDSVITGTRAQCQCGKPLRRIVGGEPAKIEDYPWMVALTRGGGRPYCGGTLINSRYVVTASHCVDGQSASRITVVLMEQDFNSNFESGARPVSVRVEHIKMHENYNNKNIDNDIALLRLAQPVALGKYIPVCLPSSNANDFTREQATVTGWGATSQGGSTSSSLRKVTVPVISNNDCNTKSKYNGKITQNMMCAGLLDRGGKDSCQGDSGGPLIIENGSRKTLIGIVSWGYGCAQAQSPGVYTRVGRYPEWILANTRGADWCQG